MDSEQETVFVAEKGRVESIFEHADVVWVGGQDGYPDVGLALEALADRGIGRVLVEGGAALNDALLDAGLVDRFHLLSSDAIVGADGVPASIHGQLPERLAQLGFGVVESRALGCDMLTTFEKI
jgi:diaminohydroxyphosphoribosylaminopyrimidine deaminase/5-amino-6-(5-phosphoribosylamino)uracil reductase